MKKHLSVLMLVNHFSALRLTLLFAVTFAAEFLLFFLRLSPEYGIENSMDRAGVKWIFAVGLFLTVLILCMAGFEFRGKQGHTLRRLRISEISVLVWQAIYNTCVLLIFWALQLIAALIMVQIVVSRFDPEFIVSTSQTVFIDFYRCDFLHSLLPLDDVSIYFRNVLSMLALGVMAATVPMRYRQGKMSIIIFPAAAFFAVSFAQGFGNVDFGIGIAVVLLLIAGYTVVKAYLGVPDEEETA